MDIGIVTLTRETIRIVINAGVSTSGLIPRALLLSVRGTLRKFLWNTAVCEIVTALLVACGGAKPPSAGRPSSQSKTSTSATLSPVKVPTPTTTADVPNAIEQEPSPDAASSFELVAESESELQLTQAGDSVFLLDTDSIVARAEGSRWETGSAIRAGLPTCEAIKRWRDTPTWHADAFALRGIFGDGPEFWLSADIPRSDGLHGTLYRWSSARWHQVREQRRPYWSYDGVSRWSNERWIALVGRTLTCMGGADCAPGPDDGCRRPRVDPCKGKPSKDEHHFEIVAGPPKPVPEPRPVGDSPGCSKSLDAVRLLSFTSGEVFTFGFDCPTESKVLCERWSPKNDHLQEPLFEPPGSRFLGVAAKSPSDIVLSTRFETARFNGTSWSNIHLLQPGFSIESLELGPDSSLWAAGFARDRGIVIRQSSNGEQQLLTVPSATTTDETRESYLPVALGLTGHGNVWLLAKHPDCALISGKCRYGIFHLGSKAASEPRPARIQPVCKKEPEPEQPLVAATPSCASVFVRLSGPRLSDPADQYLAIRRVLRGHSEFSKATFGTFHPSGGAWFGAGGLSYTLARQLVELLSHGLPRLQPVATCETPTLGERMNIDFATGSVLSKVRNVATPSNRNDGWIP
jgi:hypothetical protein